MSATMANFLQKASIPCAANPIKQAEGRCSTNVDGVCIYGGSKVAGSSGYELASMGYPNATCASAGLFAASQQPYTVNGWSVTRNANALKVNQPGL
jgi:hypothetical protein